MFRNKSVTRCPHCGKRIKTTHTFESKANSFFRSSAELAPPQPTGIGMPHSSGNITSRRESTDFMPTVESHVNVPLRQAVIRGGLVGGFIFVAGVGLIWSASYIDWNYALMVASRSPVLMLKSIGFFKLMVMATLLSASATIYVAMNHFRNQTNYYDSIINRVEEYTRTDLNGDGIIGEQTKSTPIEVKMPSPKGAKTVVYADLPGQRRKLVGFAWLVLHPQYRVNFSYYGAETAKYGKANFSKLSQIFLDRGWAFIKDETVQNSPLILTKEGKTVLFQLAKEAPEALPDDVDLTGPSSAELREGALVGRYTAIDYK